MVIFNERKGFKYRVWDIDNRVMILPPHSYSSILGAPPATLDGRCYKDGKLQHYVYMQYLGVMGVDDRELCEGDIVGYGDIGPCLIQWNAEEAKFEFIEFDNTVGVLYHELRSYTNGWIILGNIFENSELFEEDLCSIRHL